ncbi:MAG TPA: hypothetical protein VHI31_09030 [Actinomycetota bacterium]|nr:hypothetical protein [Actinomycetota bacterium]
MSPAEKSSTSKSSSSSGTTRKKPPASRSRNKTSTNARRPSSESSSGSDAKKEETPRSEGINLKRERTPFEWVLLAVASASIGAVIVGLFLYAGHKAGGEAELTVEVTDTGKMFQVGPQVELTVRNMGGSGAEEVVTEVTMGEESREVTMVRIPKDDEASAVVTFPEGTTGTPEAELLSYNTP